MYSLEILFLFPLSGSEEWNERQGPTVLCALRWLEQKVSLPVMSERQGPTVLCPLRWLEQIVSFSGDVRKTRSYSNMSITLAGTKSKFLLVMSERQGPKVLCPLRWLEQRVSLLVMSERQGPTVLHVCPLRWLEQRVSFLVMFWSSWDRNHKNLTGLSKWCSPRLRLLLHCLPQTAPEGESGQCLHCLPQTAPEGESGQCLHCLPQTAPEAESGQGLHCLPFPFGLRKHWQLKNSN